jgi:hypothetical protein
MGRRVMVVFVVAVVEVVVLQDCSEIKLEF